MAPDTGVVRPRPRIAAEAVRTARAEAARLAKQTEVARAVSGAPMPRIQVDTPTAIPRSLIAGNVRASGTISGSIERFNLQGAANATGLVVRGNAARHLVTTYSWTDALTAVIWALAVSTCAFAACNCAFAAKLFCVALSRSCWVTARCCASGV